MSEPTSGDLPKLTEDIAVLAIKVVGDVAGDPATFIQKVLDRPDVQQQLVKELESLAKKLHEQASGKLPKESAEEVGTALVKKAGDALKDGALKEIKETPSAKELTKKVEEFTGALKKTPVGVWFDKHSTTIYLIAGGAALAGAVTMYAVQAGDVVTDTVLPMLDNKKVKVKEFEFGVESLRFKPSDREVELKGFATGTWKKLTVRVSLMGKAIGTHVEAASADVNAKVVTGPWTFSATGKAAMTGDGKLGLGVTYSKDSLKIDVLADITRQTALGNVPGVTTPAVPNYGLGAKASVGYQGNAGGVPFNVGVQGNIGTAPDTGMQYGVLGTFSVTLDPVKKKK